MQALENFDEFVLDTLSQWQVPGIAVGVIKDRQIILSKGYGYRDLARHKPVTSQTLFQLASITKSFTATAAAILVDRNMLDWDRPVREYLADFQLSDEHITEKVTTRDLLAHLSGLSRHDMLWMLTGFDREAVFKRLKYLEFNAGLRQKWQYNNLMYMVVGYLTGRLAGTSWEDFIRENIFKPLGMHATHFLRETTDLDDLAKPYYLNAGKQEIAKLEWDAKNACAPAGHIISNIDNILPYLQFHLDDGEYGGRQLLSANNCRALREQQASIDESEVFKELGPLHSCMGFRSSTYRGHKTIYHDGSSIGYATRLSFMPEKNFGFILLSNMLGFNGENPVPWIIAHNLEDRLLGLDQIDWNRRLSEKQEQDRLINRKTEENEQASIVKDTQPSHALQDYIGTYQNPAYGEIQIRLTAGNSDTTFDWDFNGIESVLYHLHYDSFTAPVDVPYVVDPLCSRVLTFHANDNGVIDRLTTSMEPGFDDAVFHLVTTPSKQQAPVNRTNNRVLD